MCLFQTNSRAHTPRVSVLASLPMRRLVLVILCLGVGCGKLKGPTAPDSGSGDPIDPTATFTRVQNEVFTPSCATFACHDNIGQQQDVWLSPGHSYASLVGRASSEMPSLLRVTPGNPDASYLYRKLAGTGITGDRMPQGRSPLSAAGIKLVRDWIRRGAPND